MQTWVLLLRGINVGGNNILPMQELRDILGASECIDVKTYIQSGNAVFKAELSDPTAFGTQISEAIDARFGFTPQTLLLSVQAYNAALSDNPFPQAIDDPKTLHLFFMSHTVGDLDTAAIEDIRAETEQYELRGDVFYLYAPNGIGRSKLATKVEKILGVPTTARNLRSAMKIAELAGN